MMSFMSFVGRWLDKTTVNFEGKERFEELDKQYTKSLGAVGWIFVLLLLSLLSGAWVWYVATHPTPARFFMVEPPPQLLEEKNAQLAQESARLEGVATEKKIHEVRTSLNPKMSNLRVQAWVTRALMDTYSFDFLNYEDHFKNIQLVYRPDTFKSLYAELNKRKGLLENVRDNSLIVSLTPSSTVRIVNQGSYDGRRVWSMEMKALVYYSGSLASPPPPKRVMFKVLVEEVPPSQNPYGLVIAQISEVASK